MAAHKNKAKGKPKRRRYTTPESITNLLAGKRADGGQTTIGRRRRARMERRLKGLTA